MAFILKLTLREIRSSWRRLLFFFLCIALGVGSVVGLRALIQNLTRAVASDARALMTADLELSSTNPFTPTQLSIIDSAATRSGIVEAKNEAVTMIAMSKPVDTANDRFKMTELKGIDRSFPLVGDFLLDDGIEFTGSLLENNGALVARILLEDLNVKVGDKITLGEGEFEIRGTFEQEPGGTSGFRMGPRVFIEKKAFEDARLSSGASRVRYRILFRTSSDPTPLVQDLRRELRGTVVNIQSYRESEERLGEQFRRIENYLALTGLLILVLGGVGVWNVSRAFIDQKRKTIAVLKCLGAGGGRIITAYLLQILTLSLIGGIFGVFLAMIGLWAAQVRFGELLPDQMEYSISVSIAFQGIILGLMISTLFSVLPLLQVRNIKPKLLLRDENNAELNKLDITKWLFAILTVGGLLGISIWQSGSIAVGLFFLAGLAITTGMLYLAAAIFTGLLKRLGLGKGFILRQAVTSLYRPGNQTRVILLAVGLGTFVVTAVQAIQTNLVQEFNFSRNQSLPTLFMVDIQKGQIDHITSLIEDKTGETPVKTPMIRARIAFVNGKAVNSGRQEVRGQQGQIGREFAVTYREGLDTNEELISGRWWINDSSEVPEVSVEEEMANRLKIVPGDSITFDISGRPLTARVAGIRKIDLRNTRTVFIFVFKPGVLENAPQTYGATILNRLPENERQRLQRDVLRLFPNVQMFDVADIIETIKTLVDNFVLAISFVGGFVILSGMLILIGSIALTKSQRIYENAILKSLGAGRTKLGVIIVIEYGLLGLLAGVIGTAFAGLLSYAVSIYVLEIENQFQPLLYLTAILATTFIVMAVGAAASFDVLFKKPLATLRSQ